MPLRYCDEIPGISSFPHTSCSLQDITQYEDHVDHLGAVNPPDSFDQNWAEKWLMELNINKCYVLSITLKRNSIFHDYDILGAMPKRVTNHDYLGVTISSDLNWLRHVKKNSNNASRTLGLLIRTLSPCSQNVKSIAYKMLVRPQLEYAIEVWNPYTMKCIQKIEKFKEIHADSSFMNTVETMTLLFSLTFPLYT